MVVSVLARGIPLERAKEIAQETWLRLIENQRAGASRAGPTGSGDRAGVGFLASHARRSASRDERRRMKSADRRRRRRPCRRAGAAGGPDHPSSGSAFAVAARLSTARTGRVASSSSCMLIQELTYDELASQLQLCPHSVKQIVCEVRKRLAPP